jgi:hypothetical protein
MIDFMQVVTVTIGAVNKTIECSSKEYKEEKAIKRSLMTYEEKRKADMARFFRMTDC